MFISFKPAIDYFITREYILIDSEFKAKIQTVPEYNFNKIAEYNPNKVLSNSFIGVIQAYENQNLSVAINLVLFYKYLNILGSFSDFYNKMQLCNSKFSMAFDKYLQDFNKYLLLV